MMSKGQGKNSLFGEKSVEPYVLENNSSHEKTLCLDIQVFLFALLSTEAQDPCSYWFCRIE